MFSFLRFWIEKARIWLSKSKRFDFFCIYLFSFLSPFFIFSSSFFRKKIFFERLREWVWGRENCLKCMERKGIDSAPSPKDFLNNIFCLCTWTTFTSHKKDVFFIYILRLNVYIYICTYKREKQWWKINLFPET